MQALRPFGPECPAPKSPGGGRGGAEGRCSEVVASVACPGTPQSSVVLVRWPCPTSVCSPSCPPAKARPPSQDPGREKGPAGFRQLIPLQSKTCLLRRFQSLAYLSSCSVHSLEKSWRHFVHSLACHSNLLEAWCRQPRRRVTPAPGKRPDKAPGQTETGEASCSCLRKSKGTLVCCSRHAPPVL